MYSHLTIGSVFEYMGKTIIMYAEQDGEQTSLTREGDSYFDLTVSIERPRLSLSGYIQQEGLIDTVKTFKESKDITQAVFDAEYKRWSSQ